ncbi:hypothetical protein EBZ39_01215 [bacterium]|nr:hypothetical protein [bacterium]
MSGNWLHNIKHVNPGEPVQAGVVSRPDRTLEDRTDYLKDRLDASALGKILVDSDATICSSVLPGQPVYWNWVEKRYEPALAAVEPDANTQTLVVQPSSDCVGICLKKRSETLGDIVLRGIVDIPDLANAIVGPITPGRYYLSASEAGKLVKQRPAVTVSVCHVQGPKDSCTTIPRVVVMPHIRDFIDDHTHYRFDLITEQAATQNDAGWLPADHAVFNGKAPNGAVFGYNLSKHPALSNVWPPLPIQSVAMLWDKGLDHVGATEIPLGPNGLAICDTNGIWWMSDCVGDVPFTEPTTHPSGTAECPRYETMRVSVVYLRMLSGNDRSVVTSIVKDVDGTQEETQPTPTAATVTSPIAVTNCADDAASTGDLQLNLDLQIAASEAIGGRALKGVINRHQLTRGWITEGAFTLSNQISITGSRETPRTLTQAEKDAFDIQTTEPITLHQGVLKIDYTDQLVERELSPQIIRLSDTVERLYMDIPYLGFPGGQASLLRLRFNVPGSNLGDNLQMKISVQLFGRDGTPTQAKIMPSLYMTRRVLPAPPVGIAGGQELPTTDTALTFNSAASLYIDHVIQRESDSFAVEEGDTVLVTIGRVEDSVYGEIGVLRVTGIIYSAT